MPSTFYIVFAPLFGRTIPIHERSVQYEVIATPVPINDTAAPSTQSLADGTVINTAVPKHDLAETAWKFELRVHGASLCKVDIVESQHALGNKQNPLAIQNAKRTKFHGKWSSTRFVNNHKFICRPVDNIKLKVECEAAPSTFRDGLVFVHPPPEECWSLQPPEEAAEAAQKN